MTDIPPASQRVVVAAAKAGLDIEVVRFPQGTRTAADAAAAIGCPVGAIAKSIVVAADGQAMLVLTSGAHRVDYAKVAKAVEASVVDKADPAVARNATGFAVGGTAPFGHAQSLTMLFDRALSGYDIVWAAAGTPDTVFAITPADLLRATGAIPADVAAD